MRQPIGIIVLIALVLLAACGGSSSSSPTATSGTASPGGNSPTVTSGASPTRSSEARLCTSKDLLASVESTKGEPNHQTLKVLLTSTTNECSLTGAPTIAWYDEAGNLLTSVYPNPPGTDCPDDATQYESCVYKRSITFLPTDSQLPAGAPYGADAIVRIDNDDSVICIAPPVQPSVIGLAFAGLDLDVQAQLTGVSFGCRPSSMLAGYGPVSTGG